jgi:hypothetical protein
MKVIAAVNPCRPIQLLMYLIQAYDMEQNVHENSLLRVSSTDSGWDFTARTNMSTSSANYSSTLQNTHPQRNFFPNAYPSPRDKVLKKLLFVYNNF